MRLRRPRSVPALAVAAVLSAGLAGCGEKGEEKAFAGGEEAAREGIAVPLDGADYNVFITRQLNLRDPEDSQYYEGPEPRPGRAYYGVFIEVCNPEDSGRDIQTARSFKVVDSRGEEYEPIPLEETNVFAYHAKVLRPGECIPNQAAATSYGPTGGAMLLFEVPVEAAESRPFELEIEGVYDALENRRTVAKIELDI